MMAKRIAERTKLRDEFVEGDPRHQRGDNFGVPDRQFVPFAQRTARQANEANL
jgi:hypothetical protein